ncbi:phosphatase PAP2 family protein [Niabella aquatica]
MLLFFSCFSANAQKQGTDANLQHTDSIAAITDSLLHISKQYEKLNKDFVISSFKDGIRTVEKPLHWQQKDWLKFSVIMGTVGAAMIFDKKIQSIALHNQNNFSYGIAGIAGPVGSNYSLLVFPLVYATGLASGNKHIESIGLRGSKAMAISSAICFVSKNIIRRSRPDASETPFNYALPFGKHRYTSMPSAHTSIAFTIATVLVQEFPHEKWLAPVAYSLASLTGVSRIYHNRHWASDVILGAALGYFVTRTVYAIERKKYRKRPVFR